MLRLFKQFRDLERRIEDLEYKLKSLDDCLNYKSSDFKVKSELEVYLDEKQDIKIRPKQTTQQ
jgi:hypothetical protein